MPGNHREKQESWRGMAQLQSIFPELPEQSCTPPDALLALQRAEQPGTDELGLVQRGLGGTREEGYFILFTIAKKSLSINEK